MPRNTLVSETGHPEAIRSKKNNGKRHIRPTTGPDPQEPSQESINSRQVSKRLQHQIEILAERNAGLQHELAELARKEARARHLAHHDGLTGLPNRSLLQDRFHQAMSQAERHHKPLALLMIDLDEFKRVNDKLGHASGDKLLQAVALRLTTGIRGADTACRYGGDEFAIMLPEIDSPNIAATLAVEIGARLSEPYIIDGHKIHAAVSVGVAVYPGDGRTFDDLMKQADIAMYRAKGTGHSTSITEQPREDVGQAVLYKPAAPKNADRMRERDLFIQDEFVRAQEQQKKHQAAGGG
jgi:diguanylate cyclase (GGDEF)-like protein